MIFNWPEDKLMEIARRRVQLRARAGLQRNAVAEAYREAAPTLHLADRVLSVAHFVRAHPVVIGAALAALVAFRGRGMVAVAGRAVAVWRLWRTFSSLTSRFTA